MSSTIEVLESRDTIWTRDTVKMRVRRWVVDSQGHIHEVTIDDGKRPR